MVLSDPLTGDAATSLPPDSADGTLVVVVCRAKHLPNRRKLDKQNPYVTLRIGTTARKTPSHFRAGQTPEWTHEVRFDLTREKRPIMIVDVLDETKNDPTPIGNVEIDCSCIFSDPQNHDRGKFIYDKWFDLTLMGKRAGMIYLEMTFYPSAPILPPKIVDHHRLLHQEAENFVPDESAHNSHANSSHARISAYKSPANSLGDVSLHRSQSPPIKKYYDSTSGRHSPTRQSPSPTRHSHHHSHHHALNARPSSENAQALVPKPKQRTVADDIFVNSQGSDKSVFLKRLSFLKNSGGTYDSSDLYEDSASVPSDKGKRNGKLSSKWHKFASKFQSKDPISTLWQAESEEQDDFQVHNSYYDQDQDNDAEPPLPPPHLVSPSQSFASPTQSQPRISPVKSNPTRGAPNELPLTSLMLTTSIPFSAETIGLNKDDLPTQVYLGDKKVQSLTYEHQKHPPQNQSDEIDSKYFAPTPSEHLNYSLRLQNGHAKKEDLDLDLRTNQTGYLGNGKFSPSIFERAVQADLDEEENQENKPKVPPKIPKGLTNQEYYVIAKDQYLRDLNGNRM